MTPPITGAAAGMTKRIHRHRAPEPPALDQLPAVNANHEVAQWLEHYWRALHVPASEAQRLAVTDDRQEFHRWTGRRLNPLALGCYCYLPDATISAGAPYDALDDHAPMAANRAASPTAPVARSQGQLALPGFDATDLLDTRRLPISDEDTLAALAGLPIDDADQPDHPHGGARPHGDYRHLIFIEPDLLPLGIEVTVAHELIHLSDRVQGNPRKHRCHGYDSISVDEAAITGRDPELLRAQLREETTRREEALRRARPYRYIYVCPSCHREYPRVKRYARPVSCGRCDQRYNPAFLLEPRPLAPGEVIIPTERES